MNGIPTVFNIADAAEFPILSAIGALLGGAIGCLLGALAGAVFLRASVFWSLRTHLDFKSAYKLTLPLGFINFLFTQALIFNGARRPTDFMALQVAGGIGSFIFASFFYAAKVKNARGVKIGIGKGISIALVMALIGIALNIAFMAGFYWYLGAHFFD
jgi:hypothetical protein